MKKSATLVWRCKPGKETRFSRIKIGEPSATTKLFNSIIGERIKKNPFQRYTPSQDYLVFKAKFSKLG